MRDEPAHADARLALAALLIASVDGEQEPGWDEVWFAELDRRETEATESGATAR